MGVSKEIESFRLPGMELNGGLVVHQALGDRGDEHLNVQLGTIFGVLLESVVYEDRLLVVEVMKERGLPCLRFG